MFFPKSLLNTNKKVFIHFYYRDWQSKDAESLGSFGEPLILLDISFVSNIFFSSSVRSDCQGEPGGVRPTFGLKLGQQALRSSAQHQVRHIFISPCEKQHRAETQGCCDSSFSLLYIFSHCCSLCLVIPKDLGKSWLLVDDRGQVLRRVLKMGKALSCWFSWLHEYRSFK